MGRDFKYQIKEKDEEWKDSYEYRDWIHGLDFHISRHNDNICGGRFNRERLKEKLIELMDEFKKIMSEDGEFEEVEEAIHVYTCMLKECPADKQVFIKYD